MLSILQKLRTITLSNIHTFLDAIRDLNTVGELEQYIRDIGTVRDQLDDQAAASRARLATLNAQIATAQARCDEADEQINIFLGDDDPTNDHFALTLQIEFDQKTQLIARAREQLTIVQVQVDKYNEAVRNLDNQLLQANGKLESLRVLEEGAKADQKAAKLLSGVSIGDMPDIDNIENRLQENAAVAANQLERGLDKLTSSTGGVNPAEASAQAALLLRKQKIAQKKQTE